LLSDTFAEVAAMEAPMRTLRKLIVGPLVATMMATSAFAQTRHVVDPAAVAATVADHARQEAADRAAIREALSRSEVRRVAASAGIDLERVTAGVDTLGGDALQRAAAAARDVNDSLVGGATLVISTTTIIIALLVVILILIAVD
jgi:hypothetical protein